MSVTTLTIGTDPGPLARLEEVKKDEIAPTVIFQRLCEGELLRDIARAWALPKGAFTHWFMEKHADKYDAAMKVRADDLAHEALKVADEQQEATKKDGTTYDPDVARDKLRVETRLKLAAQWDRARYGAKDQGPAGGGVTVIVDRSCGGQIAVHAGAASVLVGGLSQERVISGTEASVDTVTEMEI